MRFEEDACMETRLINNRMPLLGRAIFPYEGTLDLNVDGIGLSYESVTHSGGLSRVAGRVLNPTSVPIYAHVTFFAVAPPPDSIYYNKRLRLHRCQSRSFARDSVTAVLLPRASRPFNVVVPTPADVDTSDVGWRVRVSIMILDGEN